MTKWDLSIKSNIELYYYRERTLKIVKILFGAGGSQLFPGFVCLEPNPGERKQGRLLVR